MKYSIYIVAFVILTGFNSCSNTKHMVNNSTVDKLELDRFLGKWYEIARYPHSFEKNLVGVTATYSMRNDGKINVLNEGYKYTLDGEHSSATGKAKIKDPSNPAHLRVSFFWIFYSDYLVMELDEQNYQWAIIGSSSPNYLWILSRTPKMDENVLNDLKSRIEKRGYDLGKLILVEQADN